MPSSAHCHISYMLKRICAINPSTVLDLGIGFGKWGFLCREYLDVFKGRLKPEQWKTYIRGIEIFKDYIHPGSEYCYNDIIPTEGLLYLLAFSRNGGMIIKDSRTGGRVELQQFGLIIAGDILEHFEKAKGTKFLMAIRNASKKALVAVPIGPGYKQGAALGNEHERHLAVWEAKELEQWGKVTLFREQVKNRPYAVLEI